MLSARYRTALVTGASAGLGAAFADMLLSEGVRVWGTARELSRLAPRAGFSPLALDLADAGGVERGFRQAEEQSGGIDLWINNAGYGLFGRFESLPPEAWRAQLDALIGGTFRLNQLAVAALRSRGRGALVNVSSLAAEFPLPYLAPYNVAKAALSALSESLMLELAGSGITVLDFRPGDYRTGFNRAMTRIPFSGTPEAAAPLERAWRSLERNLESAPPPAHAAARLRRALRRGRSGTVRSGGAFQTVLAPLFWRLAPQRLRRAALRRYFGLPT